MNIPIQPYKFAIELGFENGDYLDVVAKAESIAYDPSKEYSTWRIIQAPNGKWVSWKSESKRPVLDVTYHARREDALFVLRQQFDLLGLSEDYWVCRDLDERSETPDDDCQW